MALTRDNIAQDFVKIYDVGVSPLAGSLYRRMFNMLPAVLRRHALIRPWKWRDYASEDITVTGSNVYAESSNLKTIRSARIGTSKYLISMSQDDYTRFMSQGTATSSVPDYYLIQDKKVYTYRPPTSGLVITVNGLLNTTSESAILTVMPEDHLDAILLLLGAKLGFESLSEYERLVSQMSIDESRDKSEQIGVDEELKSIEDVIHYETNDSRDFYTH